MIFFYLSEAFKSLGRNKLGSFITVITTSVAILLTSFSILLIFLSHTIEQKLKSRVEVNLFISDSVSSNRIEELKKILVNDDQIRHVDYINKEEAKQKFIAETGEDFSNVLDVNPLPVSFSIRFKPEFVKESSLSALVDEYKKLDGVDEVVFNYSSTLKILDFINNSKMFIYIGAALLIILSIYLVFSNGRLLIHSKNEIFETMKLVGAKLDAIKIPIYLNGIFLGFFAALLSAAVYNLAIYLVTSVYYNLSFLRLYFDFNFVILFVGLFFGFIGSYFASRKISLKVNKFNN
jgi:cell division transport system permease protein